jgi:hypothetical protein
MMKGDDDSVLDALAKHSFVTVALSEEGEEEKGRRGGKTVVRLPLCVGGGGKY